MSCDCEFVENYFQVKPTSPRVTGISRTSQIYRAWVSMKKRCYAKSNKDYRHYGAKGVRVSASWFNSVKCLNEDMGPRENSRLSIDRIDGSKGYCRHNCKWSTQIEQIANRTLVKTSSHGTGVYMRENGKFRAAKSLNGKLIHLGTYDTAEGARSAYEQGSIELKKPSGF